ncbi:hypothetical protein [Shewanella psychrophila]|uniref:hypothetical protein n=1 Tax=Shewanella psychrophila TaxID=225848 RepID=UPI001475295C|nr:hypothetical protein [Shewanella psychrophila]
MRSNLHGDLSPAVSIVQILPRDAMHHPWSLNENIHVFDTLSRIYTCDKQAEPFFD